MLTQIDLAGLPLMLTQFLTMTLRYRISQTKLSSDYTSRFSNYAREEAASGLAWLRLN